jgi:hypothetical protein
VNTLWGPALVNTGRRMVLYGFVRGGVSIFVCRDCPFTIFFGALAKTDSWQGPVSALDSEPSLRCDWIQEIGHSVRLGRLLAVSVQNISDLSLSFHPQQARMQSMMTVPQGREKVDVVERENQF